MQPMSLAREAKHHAFVAKKRARRGGKKLKFGAATVLFREKQRFRPYSYDPARYADTFLEQDVEPGDVSVFPRHVFVVWTGMNEMSANRRRGLGVIQTRIGLPVHLVTPRSLDDWLVDAHPLPSAYEYLSLIHRSDYLRGYLMHHHGGAYVDVKTPLGSWRPSHDQMAADPDAWVTSYPSTHANWIGKLPGRMGRDILVNYPLMFGKSGFMMRSHTPMTAAWMRRMDTILEQKAEVLSRHPGGVYGDDERYPLSWTDLLGRVLDPLTLKHLDHVRYDDRMLLTFEGYR